MKLSTSLLLSIGHLAAVGHALDTRSEIETECYAFDGVKETNIQFNSYAACAEECHGVDASNFVYALRGSGCMCLDSLPPDDKKVDASECNVLCPGYMKHICGGAPGIYTVFAADESYFGSSNTTNTTATSTASSTTSATAMPSSSNLPSNSTSSGAPQSSSASGSSASASASVEGTSAAAPAFGASFTVVSSCVYAVAVLYALI